MSKLLDAIRRVRPVGRQSAASSRPMVRVDPDGQRILVVYLFRALGDAVLLAPALKALIERGAEVELLVQAGPARILKRLDLDWRIHTLPAALDLPAEDKKNRRSPWRVAEVAAEAKKLEAKLKKRKFDVAIDLTARADVDARRWVGATEAEHRFGWIVDDEDTETVGLTFGTPDVRFHGDRHWSRAQLLPLRPLGVERANFELEFLIGDTARDRASGLHSSEPRVLLIPGSRQTERRWNPEHFAQIGRWVVEELSGSVVVCGSPDESTLVRTIVKAIGPGARAFTGKNLETLLALVEGANAVVTNDTGPMHFAFLMKVPTLAVFTWMSPVSWGPPERDPRFIVMQTPESDSADDAEDIMTRAAIHYLDGLLACAR